MNCAISETGVPAVKMPDTPNAFNLLMSSSGIIPPTRTMISSASCSFKHEINLLVKERCAPYNMDKPITSTSSCIAAEHICTGD